MRISDWSSDVCSSDLRFGPRHDPFHPCRRAGRLPCRCRRGRAKPPFHQLAPPRDRAEREAEIVTPFNRLVARWRSVPATAAFLAAVLLLAGLGILLQRERAYAHPKAREIGKGPVWARVCHSVCI